MFETKAGDLECEEQLLKTEQRIQVQRSGADSLLFYFCELQKTSLPQLFTLENNKGVAKLHFKSSTMSWNKIAL